MAKWIVSKYDVKVGVAMKLTLYHGTRYLEVRILLENNELSNEENIAWEPYIRN